MPLELFLYSKAACEPCQHAEVLLASLASRHQCVCHVIKIDGDAELLHRYGARVPVLEHRHRIISESGVVRAEVEGWLNQHSKQLPCR